MYKLNNNLKHKLYYYEMLLCYSPDICYQI